MFSFGSLFAGIGGIDLGLERVGMTCHWQVEIDPFCQKVLAKHWPDVRRYGDVRETHGPAAHTNCRWPYEYGWCPTCLESVDLIAGGFPCQPHSVAGKRRGAADDRNLWPEFLRIVKELRPTWILAENVPGIVSLYLDTVLADLEGEDYTCWTFNIPACAFNAPHRRARIFVVAYRNESRRGRQNQKDEEYRPELQGGWYALNEFGAEGANPRGVVADTDAIRRDGRPGQQRAGRRLEFENGSKDVADTQGGAVWDDRQDERQTNRKVNALDNASAFSRRPNWWAVESGVGRVAHGVPRRVDRLRALGNAVVPQVAEWIGKQILAAWGSNGWR